MSGNNGAHLGGPLIGGRLPRVKVNFDEKMFRGMTKVIIDSAEANGGAIPMPDPAGLLALGLILDKLKVIEERVAKLEEIVSVPEDVAEGLSL